MIGQSGVRLLQCMSAGKHLTPGLQSQSTLRIEISWEGERAKGRAVDGILVPTRDQVAADGDRHQDIRMEEP
jgi:hypothetical protein